ncbi:DUF4041 domain-containing protein [uncultured Bacteroides sp.]|uniref:DUF4041 domain-containing protein n=1 Tax=uncultured Bacteroides sp. TaxID=162156 RepID=UPI0026367AA4|nr:DUF4041 domain-containing protein [uncultured Bacteroides sp.]
MYIFFAVIIIVLLITLVSSINKQNSQSHQIDDLEAHKTSLTNQVNELNYQINILKEEGEKLSARNSELEVYSSALDADKEAKERLENATLEAERIVAQAHQDLEAVKEETSVIQKSNKELIKAAKEEVEQIKLDATKHAANIIEEAENKAKTIAGEAYDIAQNAEHYTNVVKAMKNVIEGYGDAYLKPTFSLLDELAEEFGFDEAGQKLKEAREKSKMLIKNGDASTCDYVENIRKTTAKNFVLDAFNGKVDTILSMIKKDNYGTLEQKIKDAYALVNNLGAAFRNARITPLYLDARLDELKWGVVVFELKQKEKEEQRRIKEQIREEEKARREYEKAMKDAAKEEEMIRKAMEKAKLAIEKANEEQKAKFEQQLAELQVKLAEAEAKNQRALSMAQQTRSGHVYIISNIGSFGENVFKIGMTRRLEPLDRVKELGDASVPFPFDVHAMIYSEDAPSLETALHRFFVQNQVNKVNPRKEFFRIPLSEIKKEIDNRGLDVKWTISAAALEYKETLAIEKSMANDQAAKDRWIRQQNVVQDSNIFEIEES